VTLYTVTGAGSTGTDTALLGLTVTLPFETVWKTNNPGVTESAQLLLPLVSMGSYSFLVDWGDGQTGEATSWFSDSVLHTYDAPGTYTVRIAGRIDGWGFRGGGDAAKLIEVRSWGGLRLGNEGGYFDGAENVTITATDQLHLEGTTDFSDFFNDCASLKAVPGIDTWDVSAVTNMTRMFCRSEFNQDIGNWDVASVETMHAMFFSTPFNGDVRGWDVSNVSDLAAMFAYSDFNRDLGGWDVSGVTNMTSIFDYSRLSPWNYSDTLVGWSSAAALQSDVVLTALFVRYAGDAASAARQVLVDRFGWHITDAGPL
jgi:surface protein